MWELIKNNPVIKIILLLIVGIIGFGILSNIFFGAGYGNYNMGHEGGLYGRYGGMNSATGVLVYLYSVIFKLLVFSLLISFIITIIRGALLYTSGKIETLLKSPLTDPYVKATTVLGISVLALFIASPVFSILLGVNVSQGIGGYNMSMNNGYGYLNNRYNHNNTNGLIAVTLKLFLILSVMGVLLGLAMFFLKNYAGLFSSFDIFQKCSSCGKNISKTAAYCPSCGQKQGTTNLQEVAKDVPDSAPPVTSSKTVKSNEKSKNNLSNDVNINSSDSQSGVNQSS